MGKFIKEIEKAHKFYFSWRGTEKMCPAFKEKVYLSRLGWNHLVHNKRHTTKDMVMRLRNLPLARELLEKATYYQDLRQVKQYYYYAFDAILENRKIRVVVSSKGKNGKKYFLSLVVLGK